MAVEESRSRHDEAGARQSVAVISDDRLFAEGVLRLLDAGAEYTAEWNARAGDAVVERDDLVLLDSRTQGALACCVELSRERAARVILVAAPDDDAWAEDAIAAGARGILKRSASGADLICALGAVSNGVIWAPRRVMSALVERLATGAGGTPTHGLIGQRLSMREREILHHTARGLCNKELAVRLAISEATVKVHLTHIFRKLGVRGRSELAAAYFGVNSSIDDASSAPHLSLREDRVASVFSPSADGIIRKS